MIDLDALTKALARVVLGNGCIHLGSFTLEEFLMQELGITDAELEGLKHFLGENHATQAL